MTTSTDVLELLWRAFDKEDVEEIRVEACANELGVPATEPGLEDAIKDLEHQGFVSTNGITWPSRKLRLTPHGWEQCAGAFGENLKCQILSAANQGPCDGDEMLKRLQGVPKKHLISAVNLLSSNSCLDVTRAPGVFGGFLEVRCTSAGREALKRCNP